MAYNDRKYYKSVDGRLTVLLSRIPSFRPLPDEAISEIDFMTIDERQRIAEYAGALIGLLQVHIHELYIIKERASKPPAFRVVKD